MTDKIDDYEMLPNQDWKCNLCFETMTSEEITNHICQQECKLVYPKPGCIEKPGFQCDNDKDHIGNHAEKIKEGAITLTIEWSKDHWIK